MAMAEFSSSTTTSSEGMDKVVRHIVIYIAMEAEAQPTIGT